MLSYRMSSRTTNQKRKESIKEENFFSMYVDVLRAKKKVLYTIKKEIQKVN